VRAVRVVDEHVGQQLDATLELSYALLDRRGIVYFHSDRQTPARPRPRPTAMFLARRPAWPVRIARPVLLARAAR
jgi:hypothetical protein